MKILSGAIQEDTGKIFLMGKEAEIKNTQDSKNLE